MGLKLVPELAEFLGIIVGDGNIYYDRLKRTYRFVITGHLENDFSYLTDYVSNLIIKLFGKKPGIWKYKKKKAIGIALYSRQIIDSLLSLGLKAGKKSQTVEIPKLILESDKSIKSSFLRGVADTDFCISFDKSRINYPTICGSTSSKTLAYQIKELLKEFNIISTVTIRKPRGFSKVNQYVISCYGLKNYNLWVEQIGFRNENHLSKIFVWKVLGFYPPFISLKERLLILSNNNVDVLWDTTALNRKVG